MIFNKKGEKVIIEGKEFTIGGRVYANNSSLHEGLYGEVTEIRTGEDTDTDDVTHDIVVDFEIPTEPAIIKSIVNIYNDGRSIEDVPLDCLNMDAEMLEPVIKTHFKRHGSAGWLQLQDLPKQYYGEYNSRGFILIKYRVEPVVWNGKTSNRKLSEIILSIELPKSNSPEENFEYIENKVNNTIPEKIEIASFIESYYIGSNKGDRDILNGIDITDFSTREVINQCKINLCEFFAPWKVSAVEDYLNNPTEEILNKKFSELYGLIHWNCHKEDFREIFVSKIK